MRLRPRGWYVRLVSSTQLAWTSHLPQAASTALALALASAKIQPADLGPGGRSMTRLAGSSPEMWTDIALDNATALSGTLVALEEQLRDLRAALARGDTESIRGFFTAGRRWSTTGHGSSGDLP
jgi:prephenate dehydrogenase